MNTVINLDNPPAFPIGLGITGENGYRQVDFDISSWKAEYPEGVVSVIFKRPDGEIYPVSTDDLGQTIVWHIAAADVSVAGRGVVELRIISGGVIGKSVSLCTKTRQGLGNAETPPTAPAQEWVAQVLQSAAAVSESSAAAQSACAQVLSAVGKTSYIGENGNWFEWDSEAGAFADTGIPAQGPRGFSGNYPQVVNSTDTSVTLEMAANTEYVCSAGIAALTLTFGSIYAGYSTEYRIVFLTGSTAPTITLPSTVIWTPATPVFEADVWYELSIVPAGSRYVAVWSAAEVV